MRTDWSAIKAHVSNRLIARAKTLTRIASQSDLSPLGRGATDYVANKIIH